MCLCVTVSPEDSQTSVLLNQGTFSWQGPDSPTDGETGRGAAKGSLQLHSLNLHITKVRSVCQHITASMLFVLSPAELAEPVQRSEVKNFI